MKYHLSAFKKRVLVYAFEDLQHIRPPRVALQSKADLLAILNQHYTNPAWTDKIDSAIERALADIYGQRNSYVQKINIIPLKEGSE